MASERTSATPRHPTQQGLVSRSFSTLVRALVWLCLALVFSILSEWLGMVWWWPQEGVGHSERMLAQEIGYLNEDFQKSMVTSDPVRYARQFADTAYYYLFEWTGLIEFLRWLGQPPRVPDNRFRLALREIYLPAAQYVEAALIVTQVFAVRLAVLTLAMPVFVLFSLVALTEGLVRRDLRRWGGGRESSYLYHHAKRAILPSLILTWIIYLGLPVSLHPNIIVLPFAALFAVALAITASTFKKYL